VTDGVGRIPPTDRRGGDRRQMLRRAKADGDGRDLVPIAPVVEHEPPAPKSKEDGPSAFAAQLLGQDGVKRGLKGGQEVLDQARSTYLRAEHSGEGDRRPQPGQAKKTDI
jgi:hypothetical protein